MLPQIAGPGAFIPAPFAPAVAARAAQGAQPTAGETAAAALRPETAERVDPPRTLPAVFRLPEDRRRETLNPPDPDAPAGPPPAFDATPLDRAREAAFAAVDLLAEPEGVAEGTALSAEAEADVAAGADEADRPGAAVSAAAPDPSRSDPLRDLIDKVVAEVTEVRRMADPAPERTLDVTR
jgi:hypothetical protein